MEIVNDNTVVLYKCYGAGCRPFFSFYKKGYDNVKYVATIPHGCYFDTCAGWCGATLIYMPDGSPMFSPFTSANGKRFGAIGEYDHLYHEFTNIRRVGN